MIILSNPTTTVLYSALYDEVLPDVPGVMQSVALNAIRNAAIEFCDRTKVWVVDHNAVDSVANESTYLFQPPSTTVVAGVVAAWFSDVEIDPTTEYDLKSENWTTLAGTPTHYLQENSEEIILFYKPSASIVGALTMKVALKPTRASTGIDGWILEKYREEIAHGAKAKLFSMQKKPWTDTILAAFHGASFDAAVDHAKISVAKGHGTARLRTRSRYF